ncbi:MAG: hypothetical protein MJE68_01095 [Proteobacteria bacterium]|nr:hypothetical protein [Pseudomonadota bacterium]
MGGKKENEEKEQLKMERQSLDRDLKWKMLKSVQWEHQQLEHKKTSIFLERA